jgi:hypothetical protein
LFQNASKGCLTRRPFLFYKATSGSTAIKSTEYYHLVISKGSSTFGLPLTPEKKCWPKSSPQAAETCGN